MYSYVGPLIYKLLITKTLICLCSAGIYLVFVFQKMSWCCAHLLLFVSLFFSSYLCFCCFKSFLIRNDCFVCKLNKTSVKLFCVLFFWIMEKSVYFPGLQDSYNKQRIYSHLMQTDYYTVALLILMGKLVIFDLLIF